jgi:hypothetical protein
MPVARGPARHAFAATSRPTALFEKKNGSGSKDA